jgi:hypothetical protein
VAVQGDQRGTPFSRGIAPAVYHRNNFMRQKAPSRRLTQSGILRTIHQPSACGRSKAFFNSFLMRSHLYSLHVSKDSFQFAKVALRDSLFVDAKLYLILKSNQLAFFIHRCA